MELGVRLLLGRGDVAVIVDVDEALGLELVEGVLGLLVRLLHAVVVGELLLGLGEERQLGCELRLLAGLRCLGVGDLLPGSAPFATGLHEVCAYSLGHYTGNRMDIVMKHEGTYAKCGSSP